MGNLWIHMYAQALPSLHFNNQHLLRKDLQYKCSLREQSRADKRKRSDKTPRFPLFFHSFLLLQSSQPQTLTEIYNLSWLHFYSDFLKLKHKGEVHFQQDWQQHEWNLQKCPFGKHVYGALPSQLPASAAPTDSSRPTDCWEVHPENPVFTLVSQKRDSNIWNAAVNKLTSFESRWKHGLVVEAKAELSHRNVYSTSFVYWVLRMWKKKSDFLLNRGIIGQEAWMQSKNKASLLCLARNMARWIPKIITVFPLSGELSWEGRPRLGSGLQAGNQAALFLPIHGTTHRYSWANLEKPNPSSRSCSLLVRREKEAEFGLFLQWAIGS